ncbi:hypothetical protein IT570_09120 [Candidatus Sumerlaeota bacterium]|nr:hypothetical protein [Candidatus Sumerlaeota bacterium]
MILDWRFWVKFGLYAAIFDGALRKWFLPSLANPLYFMKDVIFLVAYALFLVQNGRRSIMPPELRFLRPVLALTTLIIFFQGLNPRLGSLIAGFMGMRNYLIYAPLIFLVPRLFRTKEELQSFLWNYVLTIIPVGLLGIVQFNSSPFARINTYVGDSDVVSFGRGKVRVTGPFSYISGYNTYLTMIFAFLLTLVTKIGGSKIQKFLLLGAVLLCVSNMLMTGSRMPIFSAAILTAFYVGVQFVYAQRQFRKMLPAIVIIGIVASFGVVRSPAYKSFMDRMNSVDTSTDSRLDPSSQFENFFDVFRYKDYIGGLGAGAYHPATEALRRSLGLSRGETLMMLEDETDRVLAELGAVGFVLWYGMRACFLLLLWIVFLEMRDPTLRSIAVMALGMHLLMLPGQLVFQHTAGVYYWFLAGLGALLPRLQLMEDARVEAESRQYTEIAEDDSDGTFDAQPSATHG